MISFRHMVVLLSAGLALVLGLVLRLSITNSETPPNIPVTSPVAVTGPVFEKSPNQITSPETAKFQASAKADPNAFPLTEHGILATSEWSLANQNLEWLYTVILQALESENSEEPGFQAFVLATLKMYGDLAPGEMLAMLIHTAPTTELQIDALRLLAEASQELSVANLYPGTEESGSAAAQFALEFFDGLNADAMLRAVTDVLENGDQRERLFALSTLEEMYQFAPIWEVAFSFLHDPDPQIRMRAMELLTYGDRQVATEQLLLALNDPNPDVSDLAGKLLIGLEERPS